MTDNSSTPVDLRIKRKRDDVDEYKKKKSRDHDIPLDLSVKPHQHSSPYPTSTMPLYDPTSLLYNSSALLYDLFLTNLNTYYQQQQQQQRPKVDLPPPPPPPKFPKQQPITSSRTIKDYPTTSKHESYACSCGEKYSNVSQLVSHLKVTNHSAQLSSTHDEVAKLVRGQDIWLSRDTNPANQILKCLRCSLSFETLPDLTAHMMKTNHFTQLLSTSYQHSNTKAPPPPPAPSPQQQHSPTKINARSTCLVCSQQFSREVDLVDHLQRLHHIRFNCTTCGMYFESENIYKEHLLKEMHHRNGKTSKNRDYFLNQCRTLPKRAVIENKSERAKSRSPPTIDKEVERVTSDLLDRIIPKEETSSNALSLLQNFVIQQTPTTITSLNQQIQIDLNNNCDDDENSNQSITNISDEKSPLNHLPPTKSNESPLASLEKMLAYPTTTIESPPSSINDNGTKKKKFDKYRLFAEKMLRSTLS